MDGVLLTFEDNGLGIAKEDIPHLFKRFFRSDKNLTLQLLLYYLVQNILSHYR
jgi:signal transduction histidine kinase